MTHPYRHPPTTPLTPSALCQWLNDNAPLLRDFQWFRKAHGGRWEGWYLDVVHGTFWSLRAVGSPRPPLGRGTPTVENWP